MDALKVSFFISGLIAVSLATTCYVCQSGTEESCADDYSAGDPDHEIDCDSSLAYIEDGGCSKLKSETTVIGVLSVSVTRLCGQRYGNSACDQKDREQMKTTSTSTESWYCSCEGDRCNTAVSSFKKRDSFVLMLLAVCLIKSSLTQIY